jgi:polyisoprenoid-binding protein YceI
MSVLRRHWKGVLAVAALLVVVLAVAVPYIYIHLVEGKQAAPLSLNNVSSATSATPAATSASSSSTAGSASPAGSPSTASGATVNSAASVGGTWTVSTGSLAGYRVNETLAGQKATAVGRTSAVTGSLTMNGTNVTAATFTVEMAKVTSDQSQRDQQFSGRIMDTAAYPTGSFVLTKPIALGTIPAVGVTVAATATGNLTLHGTTKSVTFTISAKRSAASIAVSGDITIAYGDYNIDNPSFGSFVSVGSSGTIEFLLITTKA